MVKIFVDGQMIEEYPGGIITNDIIPDVDGVYHIGTSSKRFGNIDGSGDLTMGTITMPGFSVDADGDTVVKSIDVNSGGITEAGAISGATTIDGSGDLTMGTITMPGFSVDADGDTVIKSLQGPAGGLTITGGTGSGDDLLLVSTTHGTKGFIHFHSSSHYIDTTGQIFLAGGPTAGGTYIGYDEGITGPEGTNIKLYFRAGHNTTTPSALLPNRIIIQDESASGLNAINVGMPGSSTPNILAYLAAGEVFRIGDATHTNYITIDEYGKIVGNTSGGISITGGTGSGDDLLLVSTTHGTKGDIQFHSGSYFITSTGALTVGAITGTTITNAGLISNTAGAAEALRLSTNVDDYTKFTLDANGGLAIQSIDAAASAANISITADGTFAVTSTGFNLSGAGAVSGATSIDGSGDLTMGTITMSGFSVGATGITDVLSLKVGGTEVIDSSRNLKNVSNTVDYFSYRRAGRYFSSILSSQLNKAVTVAVNTLWAVPFIVSKTSSFDRIAIKVTTAGDADTVGRLGIYSDDGNVYPGTLVLDAGTVAVDAAAVVEITINQQLTPGLYWLVLVHNSTTSPGTQAGNSVSGIAHQGSPYGIFGVDNTLLPHSTLGDAWYVAFNYANLPATFPADATINTAEYPLIFLRAV